MEATQSEKICYGLKSQLQVLCACGIPHVLGPLRDPSVAHWLLRPDEKRLLRLGTRS